MISIWEISPRIRWCLYKQLAFCQRAVTVLSHAATPKHCWACSQRSGTLTRCFADRKLGHFQVGDVEVHTTLEDFVTSAFICDFAVHLFTLCRDPRTAARSMSTFFVVSLDPMLESICSSLMTFLTTETKRFPGFSSSSFFGHLLLFLQVIVFFLFLNSSFLTHLVHHCPVDFQCMMFRCFRVNSLAVHVLQAEVWPFLLFELEARARLEENLFRGKLLTEARWSF